MRGILRGYIEVVQSGGSPKLRDEARAEARAVSWVPEGGSRREGEAMVVAAKGRGWLLLLLVKGSVVRV